MTDSNQIAELRGLVAKATAATGPWFIGRLKSYRGDTGSPCRCVYRGQGETAETRIMIGGGEGEHGAEFDCDADAALIVALVNAAPALLDAAERAGRLEEAVRAYCDAFDAGTGTVYVEPLMRSLLTDTTHDTAQHGEGES
jgi:hypothetical protein